MISVGKSSGMGPEATRLDHTRSVLNFQSVQRKVKRDLSTKKKFFCKGFRGILVLRIVRERYRLDLCPGDTLAGSHTNWLPYFHNSSLVKNNFVIDLNVFTLELIKIMVQFLID